MLEQSLGYSQVSKGMILNMNSAGGTTVPARAARPRNLGGRHVKKRLSVGWGWGWAQLGKRDVEQPAGDRAGQGQIRGKHVVILVEIHAEAYGDEPSEQDRRVET